MKLEYLGLLSNLSFPTRMSYMAGIVDVAFECNDGRLIMLFLFESKGSVFL